MLDLLHTNLCKLSGVMLELKDLTQRRDRSSFLRVPPLVSIILGCVCVKLRGV